MLRLPIESIDVFRGVEARCFTHLVILVISDGSKMWTTDLRQFGGGSDESVETKHGFILFHLVSQIVFA